MSDSQDTTIGGTEMSGKQKKNTSNGIPPWQFSRLRKMVKKFKNIGVFWLILSIFFFSIAVGLGMKAWKVKRENNLKIQAFSQKILSVKHETRRINDQPGIITALLTPLNEKPSREIIIPQDIKKFICEFDARANKQILVDSIYTFSLTSQTAFANLPPAILFASKLSRTLIPPTEHSLSLKNRKNGINNKNRLYKTGQVLEIETLMKDFKNEFGEISDSNVADALEAALSLHAMDLNLYNIPQVYFVSPYGIFSHRVSKDLNLLEVARKVPMHRWEASSYFQAFLRPEKLNKLNVDIQCSNNGKNPCNLLDFCNILKTIFNPHSDNPLDKSTHLNYDDFHVTRAYLDLAGLGIVRTYCRTVRGKNNKVLGIICVDEQINVDALLSQTVADGLLSDEDYRFYTGIEKVKTKRYLKWSNGIFDYYLWVKEDGAPAEFLRDTPFYNQAVENFDAIQNFQFSVNSASAANNIGIKSIRSDDKTSFLVPLKIGDNSQDLLLVTPAEPDSGDIAFWIYSLIALVISFFCLSKSTSLSAKYNERATLATILRNLPVGVLELGHLERDKEKIIYANDYAEAALGRTLTRFGEYPPPKTAPYFKDLILDNILIYNEKAAEDKYQKASLSEIRKIREQGKTSTYFAKVRRSKSDNESSESKDQSFWIRITGSSLMDIGHNQLRTFGIFIRIKDKERIDRLDKELGKSIKTNS